MIFFTADTHFGDRRLHLFSRDLVAKNSQEIDQLLIRNWNKRVKADDTIYHLGDVGITEKDVDNIQLLNGKKILIRGNYDKNFTDHFLLEYFEEVHHDLFYELVWENGNKEKIYMNHYPVNYKEGFFMITAHIHGLWKVKSNMLNVGCDAWHMFPISEDELCFYIKAIRNVYDENVFVGEKSAQSMH